jgi:hypothetical protein
MASPRLPVQSLALCRGWGKGFGFDGGLSHTHCAVDVVGRQSSRCNGSADAQAEYCSGGKKLRPWATNTLGQSACRQREGLCIRKLTDTFRAVFPNDLLLHMLPTSRRKNVPEIESLSPKFDASHNDVFRPHAFSAPSALERGMFNEAFFADVAGCEMHPFVVPVA